MYSQNIIKKVKSALYIRQSQENATGVTELFPLFSQIPYMQDISEDSKDPRYQPRARKDTQGI